MSPSSSNKEMSNLSVVQVDPLHDDLVCRLFEAGSLPLVFVFGVSSGQSFRSKVPRIAEGFVDAFEGVAAGHEDL